MEKPSYGSVIVGVDGSAASLAALRWSAARAGLLRTRVVAVRAWLPTAALRAPYAPAAGLPTPEEDRRTAAAGLEAAVVQLLEMYPQAPVSCTLDQGPPAPVLLHHARHAVLLVLGRGPRDDISRPALGAVARECVRHATCPVVTIPEPPADAKETELLWLTEDATVGAART
ncbi:universal stress protein [Streptomyces sp. TRM66268-LWL]|uniref:Universal stress protein n=1 Tax=Streptomyces polyasparticus TaxID=2767826 RepID=A0ABR7SEG7_9ACTN|nr:universal stress protein [Streptomyces polyasparticus]MBC9713886.1 universal stress protein [Streptomyces polyasparticus]